MGKRYLIDTNAIQDYLQESYPEKGLVKMDKILSLEANI
jgi:glutathione S-transferase